MGEIDIERRIAEARALVAPYEARPEIVAAIVHGSSVRPYGDDHADLDIWFVVEDADLARIDPAELHTAVRSGAQKTADLSIVARRDVATRNVDADAYFARHARLLFDKSNSIAASLREVAHLPQEVRSARMRLHHFEFTLGASKAPKAGKRGRPAEERLHGALAIASAIKTAFFGLDSWPAPTTWAFDELRVLGAPEKLVDVLRDATLTPSSAALRSVRGQLDGWLAGRGESFVRDPAAVLRWLYASDEGRAAQHRWRTVW